MTEDYISWLCEIVKGYGDTEDTSFVKLLRYLHNTPFRYSLPRDANRADDGIRFRSRFSDGYSRNEPCSVLEMMIALATRCEETIMTDGSVGDRTAQWFWGMITNMGLGGMTDTNFDERYVREVVEIFLDRQYDPTGKGGLFTVKNCDRDLREVEIWYQLLWYLDDILF